MNRGAGHSPEAKNGGRSRADERRIDPIDWAIEAGAVDEVWQETQIRIGRRRRRQFHALAGAGAALLIVAGLTGNIRPVGQRPVEEANKNGVIAASGASVVMPERQVLADGSRIELKRGAEVRVEYTAAFRRVALVRGEAHFQVVKDAHRPFVVEAGGVAVRAVGTAFAVQLETEQVEVLVTEGRVAVDRTSLELPPAPGQSDDRIQAPAPAILDAGRQMVVAREASTRMKELVAAELTASEIDARLSWRVPRLDFTRTPLAEAVPLINRHSRVRVTLGDSAVGSVRLSGILQADNIETLVRLLEAEHGVTAEWRGTGEVVLRRSR